MTLEQFSAMSEARGWKRVGSNAYGIHKSYPFSVNLSMGRFTNLTAVFRLKKRLKARDLRAIRRDAPRGCSVTQPQAGVVYLVCAGSDDGLETTLCQSMEAAVTVFREERLGPPEKCPYCGREDCDAAAARGGVSSRSLGGDPARVAVGAALGGMVGALAADALTTPPAAGYVPVHRACVQEYAAAESPRERNKLLGGSYARGLVGALLGALVGILPDLAFQLALGYSILYPLTILIPLLAWFGYRKLGGKVTMAAFWIVAAVTLLFTWFVVDQAAFYFFFSEGDWVSPLFTIGYFYDYFYVEDIVENLLKRSVWLVPGLVLVFGDCRKRRAAASVQDAAVAKESLMPYRP